MTPEGDVLSAPVTNTRTNGRQAIFTSVTLLTAPQGALNSLLVGASEDIPESETWIHVHAAGPDVRANACDAPVVHQGDVVIAEGTLPFDAPPSECVILEGNLRIEETSASRVGELDGVVEVTGDVIISTNAALTGLDGLQGLVSIGGDLYITHNPELPTEAGAVAFRDAIGLSNIGGSAFIDGNGPAKLLAFHSESIPVNPNQSHPFIRSRIDATPPARRQSSSEWSKPPSKPIF